MNGCKVFLEHKLVLLNEELDEIVLHLGAVVIRPLLHQLVETFFEGVVLGHPGVPPIDLILSTVGTSHCSRSLSLVILKLLHLGLDFFCLFAQASNCCVSALELDLNLLDQLGKLVSISQF